MSQIKFRGLDVTNPENRISAGFGAICVNVRAYFVGGFSLRNLLTAAILTVANAIQTVCRLNDSTPAGPSGGFTYVIKDSAGYVYSGTTGTLVAIGSGLSANPVSMVPFRPNTSVQPWLYIGDAPTTPAGSITYATIQAYTAPNGLTRNPFNCSGMVKVRSDGWIYKIGIEEPQGAPIVTVDTSGGPNWVVYAYTYRSSLTGATSNPSPLSAPETLLQTSDFASYTINSSYATRLTFNASQYQYDSGTNTFRTASVPAGTLTDYVIAANFGLSVPANVKIDGVQVSLNWAGQNAGTGVLSNVALYYQGSQLGVTESPAVLNQKAYTTTVSGDNTDSWGASLTPGIVNDPTFGFGVQITTLESGGSDRSFLAVWTITVYYTLISGITVTATASSDPQVDKIDFYRQDPALANLTYVGTAENASASNQQVTNVSIVTAGSGQTNGTYTIPSSGGGGTGATVQIVISGGIITNATVLTGGSGYTSVPTFTVAEGGTPGTLGATISPIAPSLADTLSDLAVATNPILEYDNYEPFPSIDLPQSGTCNVTATTESVTNIAILSVGSGQTPGTYVINSVGGGGTGAQVQIVIDASGTIIEQPSVPGPGSPIVVNPGSGYTSVPTFPVSAGGTPGTLGATISPSFPLSANVTWVPSTGGNQFNIRWLPGTIILIAGLPYVLYNRPESATTLTAVTIVMSNTGYFSYGFPPAGTGLSFEIAEPTLAAQPLAYLFGPTDNINYIFAVGDPLRPGTLYWCKGSNLDSAPDTNQMEVTDPSEPLVNGAMSFGYGVLFSIKRAWIIEPNFYNATATAQGVQGTTWSLQATQINRGLFIPRCLVATKSGNVFFRVDDGIHVSAGGVSSKSITDEALYPLFSHEGCVPQSVVRNGVTIYPPDDSQPQKQQFRYQNGYLYYSYVDTLSNPHTLVFDEAAMGWIFDTKTPEPTCYAPNEGLSVQGILAGCTDGTLRQLSSAGTETATGKVLSPAIGTEGWGHVRSWTIEYSSNSSITVTPVVADEGNGSYAPSAITLPSTSGKPTKLWGLFTPAKWKILQFEIDITNDLTAQVYLDGFSVELRAWGSDAAYQSVNPFAESGGYGGQP